MLELKILFWFATALVFYSYVGYPVLLALGNSFRRVKNPVAQGDSSDEKPFVSIMIPAYNEERWIARKIENTLALQYPKDRLEILIASDGSTDRTAEIARRFERENLTVIAFPTRLGKQEMLNRLVPGARGEVMVMTDANALLAPDAIGQLVRPFVDPNVGCAIGRRICILQERSIPSMAESFYWRYESRIKEAESRWHSCLAATGQLYAVRHNIFPHVARVGEDFYIPMKVLAVTGLRIVYVPEAVAAIPAAAKLSIEFERKTRAHVAFLISLPLLKELLAPWRTPVWWQFISHHVLRMLVPGAMLVAILCSGALASRSVFYFAATLAQFAFYGCALAGWILDEIGLRPKLFYFSFYFVFAQIALAQAWLRWPSKNFAYAWQRTDRLTDAN